MDVQVSFTVLLLPSLHVTLGVTTRAGHRPCQHGGCTKHCGGVGHVTLPRTQKSMPMHVEFVPDVVWHVSSSVALFPSLHVAPSARARAVLMLHRCSGGYLHERVVCKR